MWFLCASSGIMFAIVEANETTIGMNALLILFFFLAGYDGNELGVLFENLLCDAPLRCYLRNELCDSLIGIDLDIVFLDLLSCY